MEVECFGDHVWIEPLDAPEKLGGLFLDPIQKAKIEQRGVGMVANLGPAVNSNRAMRGDPEIGVGDVVAYWKHVAGTIHGLNTRMYVFVKEEAIVARIKRDPHASTAEIQAAKEKAKQVNDALSGPAAGILTAAGGFPPGPHLAQ